ncbi:MAG: PSP1 domain-containing protein [Gemmatirosa sp.]
MSHLVEIAFKGNRKEFYLWDGDDPPKARASVIVEGDRGEDLGEVHATGELAAKRWAGVAHGEAMLGAGAQPQRRALRLAAVDEVRRAAELEPLNEEARRKAMERVRAHNLVMKISDADWQWDRRKLTLYFTAEKRVDFRALVRDLAALFRTRIELKQIGVRDEAKRLDGVGRCGRQYCSAAWLPELRPVNLSVAKDQRLSLNPTQISGACGRLMCSLRYEHDFYVQQRKRFPKEGKVLTTSKGEEKVLGNDIFRERVTLRALDGEVRVVPLADLRGEMEALAGPFSAPAGAIADDADGGHHEAPLDAHDEAPQDLPELEGALGLEPHARTPRREPPVRTSGDRRGPDRREGDRREGERRDDRPSDRREPTMRPASPRTPPRSQPRMPPMIIGDLEGVSLDGVTQEMPIMRLPVSEPDAPASESADGTEGGEPRPRRRRGRRGGRRNRGGRGEGGAAGTEGIEGADDAHDDGPDHGPDEGGDAGDE